MANETVNFKARGKSRSTGDWVEGYYVFMKGDHCIYAEKKGDICSFCIVEKHSVGAYTGLTDDAGLMIYEGDMVELKLDGKAFMAIAVFDITVNGFCFCECSTKEIMTVMDLSRHEEIEIRLKGNAYDKEEWINSKIEG